MSCKLQFQVFSIKQKIIFNPFPTKDVYIRPPWCHAMTKDVYIRPCTNGIAQSLVVRYCLNTFTPVVAYDEALVEVLADNDWDLSNLSEESDFYESSDPEESSEEKMPDEKVEDLPDEREEPQQNPRQGVERGVGRGQN